MRIVVQKPENISALSAAYNISPVITKKFTPSFQAKISARDLLSATSSFDSTE